MKCGVSHLAKRGVSRLERQLIPCSGPRITRIPTKENKDPLNTFNIF